MTMLKLQQQVTQQVAPVWPLARSIAVNPWWQQHQQPIADVAARQWARKNVRMLMPPSYYKECWLSSIQEHHLRTAAALEQVPMSVAELLNALSHANASEQRCEPALPSVASLLDATSASAKQLPWATEIVQQISQFCALWVNYPEQFDARSREDAMYLAWRDIVRHDRGIALVVGDTQVRRLLAQLPRTSEELWQQVIAAVALPDVAQQQAWLERILHDVYGWASIFAQRRWERQGASGAHENDALNQLLTIRLAWEWVCWQRATSCQQQALRECYARLPELEADAQQSHAPLWVWQRALELSYQQQLQHKLQTALASPTPPATLQAVFCIDVRSEPIRRALEAQSEQVQTFGFAGFFGLPLNYCVSDGLQKPQVPGLLSAQFSVQQAADATAHARRRRSWRAASWHRSLESPAGAYGWVEMSGLAKVWKLLERSFFPKPQLRIGSEVIRESAWQIRHHDQPLSVAQQANLAANALKGMGLTREFAPAVVLVGHSACVTNNPHAASLDCGACGGQSGEVNARVLAQLFNDHQVRTHLAHEYGIHIPEQTVFYAALHDTTQQQLRLLSASQAPAMVAAYFTKASSLAQQEQRTRLVDRPQALNALSRRAANWAELRPEWGLARNAAMIIGPRAATRKSHFDGRTFLHSYDAAQDPDAGLLRQLLTAPMVVAHWINMQYYGSMTAPETFGSGNKMLHNVVADGVGVFEGNGGDLRIGLAKQSLHDGQQWYHQPLRLTVVVAAPIEALELVLASEKVVRDLVEQHWLHLWQWQPATGALKQRCDGRWHELSEALFDAVDIS
ncbi:DUF2309 domain-containing protein [Pseudidiomarina sediminum]|uniref:Probable inorganic carbon transporter subunit DabA n=1 Tax=Pseudidiomarina sediminum TaxID=431675 RepID=A0A432Z4C2_9GAMM|nr:DUF2309 domain-containing protein [Pseudidiomarina sediminum]RUO72693.1 DUF2309 domain-containing protein [Pseudidiomarina sediminum]